MNGMRPAGGAKWWFLLSLVGVGLAICAGGIWRHSMRVRDTTAPMVAIAAPSEQSTVSGVTLTVAAQTADDIGVTGVQFQLDGSDLGEIVSTVPYRITWDTTTARDGLHSLGAIAWDAAGNTSSAPSVSIIVANNQPPVLIPIGDLSIPEGAPLTFTVSATDPDGDILTYAVSPLPPEASFDPASQTFFWTPGFDQAGTYQVTVTASDGALSASVLTTITAMNTNRAPTAEDQRVTMTENTPTAVLLTAVDVDSDPLSYTISRSPSHGILAGEPPMVTYTPEAEFSGLDHFTFQVSDGMAESNVATVLLSVSPVNDPPVAEFTASPLSGEAPLRVYYDASLSRDVEGHLARYAWAFGDGASGRGKAVDHLYTAAGTYEVLLTVTDSQGTAVTASATVTVDSPLVQPMAGYTITVSPGQVPVGGTLGVSWTAPAGSPTQDWIGLYEVGASNDRFIWWRYTNGAVIAHVTVVAPETSGTYEFRYLLRDSYTAVAISNGVTVE